MLRVRFFELTDPGQKREVGSIVWDGQSLRVEADPAPKQDPALLTDHAALTKILAQSMPVRVGGKVQGVTAQDNPLAWLEGLHRHFSGTYFYATKPERA